MWNGEKQIQPVVKSVITSKPLFLHNYLEVISPYFLPFMYFQMENQVVVSDYTQMDRVLREERQYILDICKKIKKAGCNVLLIQKSILRFVANRNSVSGNYSNNHYHSMFFSFLLIGQELTMRPANNCLQISVKLQIFCSCVIETMFLRKIQQVGSLSRQRVIWDI